MIPFRSAVSDDTEAAPAQSHLDAIDRRVDELTCALHDKRDAATWHRREAKEKDAEADRVRDELNMLNEARVLIGRAS